MIDWNEYALTILVIVVGMYALTTLADWLNLTALHQPAPPNLSDLYDVDAYAKSQEYHRLGTWLAIGESTTSVIAFLIFWLAGGFGWLDLQVRQLTTHPILAGMAYIGALSVFSYLIELPFTLLDTFWLEERFGFNRTTWGTFLIDQLKTLVLLALIGLPLVAALVAFFDRWPTHGWWIAWLVVTLFSLGLSYLAPTLIMPLFNKFEPLQDGTLKSEIDALAARCDFPLQDIYVMDGSRRSNKSNAFFTGLGRRKRIALYDTLVNNHSTAELLAVLAHEIGHYKKRHIHQQMLLGILQTGLMCFLLGKTLNNPGLFAAFGVRDLSVYASMVFFSILFRPLSRLISVGLAILSRRNEYEADQFATQAVGSAEPLSSALRKLAKTNLSNLTPHPLQVFLNYSHPPLRERLAALTRHPSHVE
ncbi:MAG: M48 family metallopeptidase [Pirellulales bacterium]